LVVGAITLVLIVGIRVHNKTDPHKKLDVMKRVVDQVHDNWSGPEMIRWSFGGGEPTVNPDFLPLVAYIKSRGDYVLTVSNGSRNPEYYAKLARVVDCIQLSVHFEYWKSDNFVLNDRYNTQGIQRTRAWMDGCQNHVQAWSCARRN